MELGKNVTIGQFVDRDSQVHRLDPRTKILALILLLIGLFMTKTYLGYFTFFFLVFLLIRASGLPLGYTLSGLKPMVPVLVILWVFQLLFGGSAHEGSPILFQFSFITATLDALHRGTMSILRVIILVLLTSILTLATDIVDLTDGGEALMRPFQKVGLPANELAMVFTIALRFVPTLIDELEKIMKAQIARGADLETGNFVRRTRKLLPLLIPLFYNSFQRAEELILAMDARCYTGGKGRSKLVHLRFGTADYVALLLIILFDIGVLILAGRIPVSLMLKG